MKYSLLGLIAIPSLAMCQAPTGVKGLLFGKKFKPQYVTVRVNNYPLTTKSQGKVVDEAIPVSVIFSVTNEVFAKNKMELTLLLSRNQVNRPYQLVWMPYPLNTPEGRKQSFPIAKAASVGRGLLGTTCTSDVRSKNYPEKVLLQLALAKPSGKSVAGNIRMKLPNGDWLSGPFIANCD